MKKIISILIAGGICLTANAQTDSLHKVKHCYTADLSHWAVDVNLLGGWLTQKYTTANTVGNYPNGVNVYPGSLKFSSSGSAYGFDAELDYFFGESKHFGVGLGFNYMHQAGTAKLDSFHSEFQSYVGDTTFRQVVSSKGAIEEKLSSTNINIPILLKYQNRFSRHWGISVDLGALLNLQEKHTYTTNAAFDYEAIFAYKEGQYVYDPTPVPNSGDVLFTKSQYYRNSEASTSFANLYPTVRDYFIAESKTGIPVGLGVRPNSNSGSVTFNSLTIGLIFRPTVNYYFSDRVALNIGGYYMYLPYKNDAQNGYELTNGMGHYSSVLNNVTAAPSHAFGGNVGVRIYIGKPKDTDKDGVPDKIDRCPQVAGLKLFHGCPDSDGDGIADPDDSCPKQAGLVQFNGCPDSDGDGIPDKEDACPFKAGLAQFHGCPDTDGDGIPDKDDKCPKVAGLKQFQGCPDSDGDGIPDNEDKCPTVAGPASNQGCPVEDSKPAPAHEELKKPILFAPNKTVVKKQSEPILEDAINAMKQDPEAMIIVDGYTDNTGAKSYNNKLSLKRANAVKAKLVKMGADAGRIQIDGYGSNKPAATNKTKAGRLQNRRAVMHLQVKE